MEAVLREEVLARQPPEAQAIIRLLLAWVAEADERRGRTWLALCGDLAEALFGTQSASGSGFVKTVLTVIETCRQQGPSIFALLTAGVEAYVSHQPAPLLLPAA